MWLIIGLIIIALVLLIVELVLLPGLSIAGIFSIVAFVGAVVYAYLEYGATWGSVVLVSALIFAVITTIITMKAGTWKRLSLNQTIDSTSNTLPQEQDIKIGDVGVTLTRLAPMGKAMFGNITVEAKSPVSYIDQKQEVEVVDFDNSVVIVKPRV